MRWLAFAAALVMAGGRAAAQDGAIERLTAAQVAAQKLDDCFDRNYRPERDKPDDRSQRRLLEACSTEWDAATQACGANTGKPEEACRKQTGVLAKDYLGLKGALQ